MPRWDMWLGKFVHECEMRPRFYGFAYYSPYKCGAWYYPIPLNWVVKAFREIFMFAAHPRETRRDVVDAIKAAWLRDRAELNEYRRKNKE